MAHKAPAAAAAAAWACLLFLLAVSCGCRLALATGRGALAADEQAVATYERDSYHDECLDDGALCSRAGECCSGMCLRHTCWSNPHQRPPCWQHHQQCLDSEDCCGSLVCRHAHGHPHRVCRVCPFVRVTPPSAPVVICESSTATDVAVAFNVATNNGATLNVPATITASDGRVCSLNGSSTTAVPSPSTVEYACPQLNGTWSPPGDFTLTLTASAGPVGCESTGSATATVTITDQPAVTVTPPSGTVIVCNTSTATDVAVAFTVATDNGDQLSVPGTITASDGRVCRLNGSTNTGVPSPSTVEYACPQLNGTWAPGNFTLTLAASAGPVGCTGADSAAATVTITARTCRPFDYTGGWQEFTVPLGVTSITINAYGAQGGSVDRPSLGGLGARMSGAFTVSPGARLIILVGGEGQAQVSNSAYSGGGGGGTFVVREDPAAPDVITSGPYAGKNVTALVIAGGGGGVVSLSRDPAYPGVTEENGTTSDGVVKTSGTGLGGGVSEEFFGSGGGGFRGDGVDDFPWGTGGKSFLSGGEGGVTSGPSDCTTQQTTTIGGFGGGGGGGCDGGGGGGGYSGGDGGYRAGGGGSFNAGNPQLNAAGVQSGNGFVEVCYC